MTDHHGTTPPSFVDLLRGRARERTQRCVFVFQSDGGEGIESELTYGELDRRARAVAAHLQAAGLSAGDRALLLYPPGVEYVVGLFGCLYAGVVAVPAYPPDPARPARTLPRLRAVAADCEPAAALTIGALLAMRDAVLAADDPLRALGWLASDAIAPGAEEAWRPPALGREAPAILQYTSGSTGAPRGVVLRHGNLLHNSELIRRAFDLSPDPRGVIWLPPYHDMGLIGGILQPIYTEITTLLMSPLTFLHRPMRWLEAVSRHGATISGGPNFAFDLCVRKSTPEQRARLDLSRWELAFCGAEPVRAETLDRFARAFAPSGFRREAFYPCYGLAEATLIVSGGRRGRGPIARGFVREALGRGAAIPAPDGGAAAATQSLVGCGGALLEQPLRIVDPETGRAAPDGRVGEIWTAGPSVASGYFRSPEETARTFGARIAEDPAAGPFLRTGDLGFVHGGELFVTGRLKDLIVVRGRNVYPQDIERTAEEAHPAVRRGCSAAFGIDAGGEERVIVAIEVDPRGDPDLAEVAGAVRDAVLAEHEVLPHAVVPVRAGAIPKTSSGKVQRRACREEHLRGALDVLAAPADARGFGPGHAAPAPGEARPTSAADVVASAPERRTEALAAYLRALAARATGNDVAGGSLSQPAATLGLDSLAAVEVAHALERDLGVIVSPAALLREATMAEIAAGLAGSIADPPPPARGDHGGAQGGEAPLTYGQAALWHLHQLEPGSAAYNVACAVRVRSAVDAAALRGALQALVDRHGALRTTYKLREGVPVACVAASARLSFTAVDAAGWDEARLRAAVEDAAWAPFDLARGPVFRAHLFTRAEAEGDDHVLLLGVHHVASDLWTLVVLLGELRELYPAQRAGAPAALPPLAADYPAFARFQREALASGALAAAEAYWRARLAGLAPLELPADRPRPAVRTSRGAAHRFVIDAATTAALRARAAEAGSTLYAALLAGFAALLGRYAGQRDVAIGSPAAGRTRARFARVAGYFVNPLVMRFDLGAAPTFRALLAQARGVVLGALEHQDYPFPLLVERLVPARDPSRTPLVEAALALEQPPGRDAGEIAPFVLGEPGARIDLGGLAAESYPLAPRATPFDLTLALAPTGGGLSASLQYSTARFEPETAARIAAHLSALLSAAAAAPDAPLSSLQLSSEEERAALLRAARSEPAGAIEPPPPVTALFAQQAARHPARAALVVGERALSYGALDRSANRLAHHLRALGVGPGARVALHLERSTEQFVALLAVLKAGMAYVPLDPAYPAERLQYMLEDARPAVLVTAGAPRGALTPPRGAVVVRLDADGDAISRRPDDAPPPSAGDARDELAYAIYTSGSTGRPKGVAVTRGALACSTAARLAFYREPVRAFLLLSSFAFDSSVAGIFWTLCQGGTLVVPDEETLRAPDRLVALAQERAVSHLLCIPSLHAALLERADRGQLDALAAAIVAGEACPPELVDRHHARLPGVPLFNEYGPTEATVWSTVHACRPGDRRVPIGRPIPGAEVYVLDDALEPAPAGVVGQVFVGGPGLARGYLARPGLTAERFVPHPFADRPGARLYATGDLARVLPGGDLEFCGRNDRQIKLRGARIELEEIEAALARHRAVREAAVTVYQAAPGDPRLAAYVVATDGASPPGGEELRAHLRASLPESMVPAVFAWLDALPRSPNGKVDRRALPAPDAARRDLAAPYVPPGGRVEQTVSEIWRELLGVARVGADDSFFDLGGHSLLIHRLRERLRDALGHDFPVLELFRHPTVRTQAAYLDALGKGGPQARPDEDEVAQGAALAQGRERLRRRLARRPHGGDDE